MDIDREQLEFLMSQAIDGSLSSEDVERLERALAADPAARAEFERMKRLDSLIGQWGRQSLPFDDERVGRLVAQRVHQDAEFTISQVLDGDEQSERDLAAHARRDPDLGLVEHQYRRLEGIVRAWGTIEPPVDHERLYDRLCQTIHAEASRRASVWPRRIIRLYAPLAAAASLLIVAGLWWADRPLRTMPSAGPSRVEIALVGPPPAKVQAEAVVEVSFALAPDAPIQTVARADSASGSGVVISIGGFQGPRDAPASGSDEVVF